MHAQSHKHGTPSPERGPPQRGMHVCGCWPCPQAVKSLMDENLGWRGFFRGFGPRTISNGLNSAVFFCFFEAIRRVSPLQAHKVFNGGLRVQLLVLAIRQTGGVGRG